MHSIGGRVLEHIRQTRPDTPQRVIADQIGMTPDSFSRALNDKRSFSSIELARLADLLHADIHWLITGQPDPRRLIVVARHDFDPETGDRSVPGRRDDEPILRNIELAYRQAYPGPQHQPDLPDCPAKVRVALGEGFVRPFADRLEGALGVDVLRLNGLSTAYSFTVGGHRVIALPVTGNWFRDNWSLAHELGHHARGHHARESERSARRQGEAEANAFAADLLLPRDLIDDVPWESLDAAGLADLVWRWGVSTEALAHRLKAVNSYVPDLVREWAQCATQRLLRRHWVADAEADEITLRMDAATQRRIPLSLQQAHIEAIATGRLGKETLAWLLQVDPEALEVDSPAIPEVDVDDLAEALGL